ncbi:MAG: hypothetical protein QNJ08_18120, partial [Crocosphaera sp.]|nr:hypothetical protein [Crocosphaera sp.]
MIQPNLLQKLAIAGITIFGVGISTMPQKAQAAALGVDGTYGSCAFAVAVAFAGFSTDSDSDFSCRPTGLSNAVSATAIAGVTTGFQGVTVTASVQPSGSLTGTVADLDVGVSLVPPGFGAADLGDPLVDPIIPIPNIAATANLEIESILDASNILRITGTGNVNENAAIELAVLDTDILHQYRKTQQQKTENKFLSSYHQNKPCSLFPVPCSLSKLASFI